MQHCGVFLSTATHEPQSWCSSVYALDTPVDGALPPQWVTVYLLVHILRYQLEATQRDLLTASVQSPMYGVMQSIRATLEETKGMYVVVHTIKPQNDQLPEEIFFPEKSWWDSNPQHTLLSRLSALPTKLLFMYNTSSITVSKL